MREKLQRFMTGRYGMDQFGRALVGLWFVAFIVSLFVPTRIKAVLNAVMIFLFVYTYIRAFSRNTSARYAENEWFLSKSAGIRRFFGTKKNHMEQRKYYHLYKCPSCKQTVRVPKGKGKIMITCPKCRTEFMKNAK